MLMQVVNAGAQDVDASRQRWRLAEASTHSSSHGKQERSELRDHGIHSGTPTPSPAVQNGERG
jgi:hypothetical protein